MFSKFSKYIINYSVTILFLIILLTSFFFYKAFISEDKLAIDFSLEQLFPENDPETEIYEQFKKDYGREDNTVFLTLSNDDIFSDNNLSILEMVNYNLQNLDSISSDNDPTRKIKPIEFSFSFF